MIKVSARRLRKGLEEDRHAVLPLFIANHREPFDIGEVFYVKLDVLPRRPCVPAVETAHVEQNAQFSVLPDESLELIHKVLVICLHQLSADVKDEYLPAIFFIQLNGHLELLGFDSVSFLRSALTPLPVPDFRHVFAVLVDVLLVLDEFVPHVLFQVGALGT